MSDSDTSAPLTSDTNFAAKTGEGQVIIDEGTATEELAYATGKSGSSLTIPLVNRGLEGGSAQAHSSGATVKGVITAGMWNDLVDSTVNILDKTLGTIDRTKLVAAMNPPEGFLINGKIVPSVASNNLTVAIKGMDGNDPSATNPVYVRIGDTIRSITGALSVTHNAATNWFNSGSAELATKEVDYFVYLYYSSVAGHAQTPGVYAFISRLPYATVAGNFSSTLTNEKGGDAGYYVAEGSAAATDPCVVIGRFAATLSAGAGYTWTVPTFTAINLIQRPVYETRWLDWVPTVTGSGSMTMASTSVTIAKYKILSTGDVTLRGEISSTTGGVASTSMLFTLPFASLDGGWNILGTSYIYDGAEVTGMCAMNNSTTVMRVVKYNLANWALTAGATSRFVGSYAI